MNTQRGFTLVELMVVMAVVAILAVISVPSLRILLIQGHLDEAKPYLMSIAAAQRIYYNRNGTWYAATDEQDLESTLGLNLEDAANFCFLVKTSNFITSGTTPSFEVWAVLRDSTATGNDVVTVENTSVNCTTADAKLGATGWVQDRGEIGGLGRVVVMRYPAPSDGLDQVNTDTHRSGAVTLHDWVSGISVSDALQP